MISWQKDECVQISDFLLNTIFNSVSHYAPTYILLREGGTYILLFIVSDQGQQTINEGNYMKLYIAYSLNLLVVQFRALDFVHRPDF
jgi:hypothetical protein